MSPLLLLAVPEVDNIADATRVLRAQEMEGEVAPYQPVDWEEDLARGGGPCLALGAERRASPR